MSDDRRAIESNPSQAFSGLCQFIDWRIEFKRLHCQEIESTWSAGADHFVRFRFQKRLLVLDYMLDLKDPDIAQALFNKLHICLLNLQQAPSIKTNESES